MNTAELDKLYELLDTIPETTVLILYLPTLEIDPKKSAKWRTFLKKLDTRGFSLPSLRLKDNELENTSAAKPKRQTACSPASLPSASCSTSATT